MIFLAKLVIYFCFNALLATPLIYFISQPYKPRSALRLIHTRTTPHQDPRRHSHHPRTNYHSTHHFHTNSHYTPHPHPQLTPRHTLLTPLPTNRVRYGIIISWFETRPYTKAIVCGRFIFI